MTSYREALNTSVSLGNMPNPSIYRTKFMLWAEDICELLAEIYIRDYDQVALDMQELLGLLDEDGE